MIGPRAVASWVAFAAITAIALPASAEPPAPDGPPPTAPGSPASPAASPKPRVGFESRAIRTADAVVVGTAKLLANTTVKGTTIARVEVEKRLKGTIDSSFTLFIAGPRNTDDPRAPSAPYIDATARHSVLFLKASPNGSGWSLLTLFSIEDRAGQEKLGVLERELEVFAIEAPAERRQKTVALYESLIADVSSWTKTHGIREVETLSREAPEAFDDAALARLDALRPSILDRTERAVLAATLDRLDPNESRRQRGAATVAAPTEAVSGSLGTRKGFASGSDIADAPPSPLESRGYRKAKARFETAIDDDTKIAALSEMARLGKDLSSPDLLAAFMTGSPSVRERAAVLLADVGSLTAWPSLRAAYASETEAVVREAVLRAAGFLGSADDVAFIVTASDRSLVRARCFALARIRTPAALAALTAERTAARSSTPPDTATATLVDYLMTPAFVKTDPAIQVRTAEKPAGPESAPDSTPPPRHPSRSDDATK